MKDVPRPPKEVSTEAYRIRILWADESADVRQCVRSVLGTQFDVQTVADAELALELAGAAPPDLVCAPALMCRKDGVELARALRALPGLSQTIVLLSCTRSQALECPEELLRYADDLLPMPLSAQELWARIRMHARLLRARNEALERVRDSERGLHEWEARLHSVGLANDALLATLGHELRTPLTGILLWASSLRGRQVPEAELDHAVDAIVASAHTQWQRIDVLLDMSRFAAGKLVLSCRPVSLDALVRSAHAGTLEAHSAGLGQGTSLELRLPQQRAERSGTEAVLVPSEPARRALRGRVVLVVEDHEGTRDAMQFVLERAGMRVVLAGSGPEALALLGARAEAAEEPCERSSRSGAPNDIDVILCDLELPGMDGYEFIAHIARADQGRTRPPPACAVSGHARERDRQRAIAAGFDLHLTKPFTAERLIEAVDDLCQVAAAQAVAS